MFAILVLLWLCWAPATSAWNPDGGDVAAKTIVSVSFAILGGFSALSLSKGLPAGVTWLRVGWTCAFAATALVGAWELVSGGHLESNPDLRFSRLPYVTSTFFNPNDYASFLLACLPALLWGAIDARSLRSRALFCAMIIAWASLAANTQSRTGVLGAAIAAPVIIYWLWRSARVNKRSAVFSLVVIGGTISVTLIALVTTDSGRRIADGLHSLFHEDWYTAQSDQERVNLTRLGWRLFLDSGMLGQGPGAFERVALTDPQRLAIGHLTKPHNSFIELASEYGILLIAPLLLLMASAIFTALRSHRLDYLHPQVLHLRMSVILGSCAFLAGGIASSSTLASPWWWVLLGYISAQAWVLHRTHADTPRSVPTKSDASRSA